MQRTVDVVIGIVIRDGKVLICQRPADTTFPNCWEFPGGKREAGETLEECLLRELREELEITVRPVIALTPIEHDYPAGRIRLCPYFCELIDGEPQPIGCQRLEWIDPPALRGYPFPPANDGLIEEVIARIASLI